MQPRFISTFCTWFWALQVPCSLSPRPRASPAIFLLPRLPGFPLHRETKQHQVRTLQVHSEVLITGHPSLRCPSDTAPVLVQAGRPPCPCPCPHTGVLGGVSALRDGRGRSHPHSTWNDSKLQQFALAKQFWTFIPELLLAVSYQVDKLTAEYMWKPRMFKTAYIFITHIDCPRLKKYVYMATIFCVRTVNKCQSSHQAQNQ